MKQNLPNRKNIREFMATGRRISLNEPKLIKLRINFYLNRIFRKFWIKSSQNLQILITVITRSWNRSVLPQKVCQSFDYFL